MWQEFWLAQKQPHRYVLQQELACFKLICCAWRQGTEVFQQIPTCGSAKDFTNSTEQSPSRKTISFTAIKEIPRIL